MIRLKHGDQTEIVLNSDEDGIDAVLIIKFAVDKICLFCCLYCLEAALLLPAHG